MQQKRYLGIHLERVGLTLDERPVLRAINWHIQAGERWVLAGPNGAGKTQLMKLLAGDVWPTADGRGRRRYQWRGEVFDEPHDIKHEIAYVGAERQDRYEHYDWNFAVEAIIGTGLHRTDIPLDPLTRAHRAEIARLLRRLGIEHLRRRRFLTLSYGERRLVLLARALASRPKLLLLDELFNGLDALNHERVARCLRQISRTQLPWVLSTHRLDDIPATVTHLCRLKAGRVIEQQRLTQRRRRQLQAANLLSSETAPSAASSLPLTVTQPLITLKRATVWREGKVALKAVSLQVRSGECWVVYGGNGSGKSTFIQLLYGDLSAASGGAVWRAGIEPGVALEVFKHRVGMVAPELQAIHPHYLKVEEVVASGLHSSVGLQSASRTRERALVAQALRHVGAGALLGRGLRALSYGQLRRVLFARALVHEPDILLLDEPYAGLDALTQSSLRAMVQASVESGVTVVMASHHRDEWPRGVTHELELARGRVLYGGALRAAARSRSR